jgi:hypothetical protein
VNKSLLIFLVFFATAQSIALSQVLTGNVLDGLDRGFLDNVWVINLQNRDSSLTNERGYFRVRASEGDSILFSKNYYLQKVLISGKEKHILTDIYLDARTLPRFDLYGEKFVIPFKVGNQSSMRGLTDRPAGPGKIYTGLANNPSLQPGLTIDGPISYFMKSERQKRQYARKLAFLASQEDYLKLIQSDSVMAALKYEYNLTDEDLDGLIIEFNLQNMDHQFVGMEWERVQKLLLDFFDSRAGYRRKEDF